MSTNFRWFTVAALSAAAVLPVPVRAQAQMQSGNVRSGNGVNYVRAARSVPSRSVVAAPSFHPTPIRRPTFNAARIQNFNNAQQSASIGMGTRPTFQPLQRVVAPNLGNRQSVTGSGMLNLNLGTNRIANSNPAPQGTSSNQQLAQTNNSSRVSGNNPRNHVFAQRSANWHPDWDHNHDHWWHGHLCHFVNNTWIIFEVGFNPWWWYGYPYDYNYSPYSYGSTGYSPYGYAPNGYSYGYNSGYYNDGTSRAVLAFRKTNNMARNGFASPAVYSLVFRHRGRFKLRFPRAGRHVEFDWSRQVLVLARGGRAWRSAHQGATSEHARPSERDG